MAIDLGDMPKGTPPTPQQQAQIRSSIGLGSSGSAGFSSLVLTGQSITGTAANSLLDLATTWNTSGIPSAIKLNVNDVFSSPSSNLLDLQVGGVSKVRVGKGGAIALNTGADGFAGLSGTGIISTNLYLLGQSSANGRSVLSMSSSGWIGWTSGSPAYSMMDTILSQDAAGIMVQKNLGNRQTFRLYNSTDVHTPNPTNYDRGVMEWSASNVLRIGTEIGGTYTTARAIDFVTGGTARWNISTTGTLSTFSNSLNIGTGNQVIAISPYGIDAVGNSLSRANSVLLTSSTASASAVNTARIDSPSAGLVEIRSADDTAYANLGAAQLSLSLGTTAGASAGQLALKTTDGSNAYVGIMGGGYNTIGLWAPGANVTGSPGLSVGSSLIVLNLPISEQSTSIRLNGRGDIGATNPGVLINSGGAAVKAFAIRAFTSQTATLTEWQNSAGAILGSVSAIGDLSLAGSSGVILTGGGGFRATSYIDVNTIGITTSSTGVIGFSSGANGATYDTALFRDAAGTLAQRNAGVAQTFRIYNTYTDATTFERLNLKWDTNVLKIGTEKGSVGGAARDLVLETDATERLRVLSTGNTLIKDSLELNTLAPLVAVIKPVLTLYRNGSGGDGSSILWKRDGGQEIADIRCHSTASTPSLSVNLRHNYIATGSLATFVQSGATTGYINFGLANGIINATTNIYNSAFAQNTIGLVLGNMSSGANSNIDIHFHNLTSQVHAAIRGIYAGTAKIGGLSFLTANGSTLVEALRITPTSNVGIGTTAPISNLEVAQSTTGTGLISVDAAGTTVTGVGTQFLNTFKIGDTITSAGQTLTISAIASDTSMTTSAAGAAIVAAGYTLVGGSILNVKGNGRVGIGVTTPSSILDINDGTANQKNVTLTIRNGNFGWWTMTSSNPNSAGFLRFASSNSGRNPLTLDGVTGNVGIEKSTPTAKLDISDINLSGSGALAGSALNIEQTWNTTGNPSMIYGRVTNTASGASSNLINLGTVASGELFKVTKAGNVSFGSAVGFHQSLEPFGNTAFNIKCYGTVVGGFASTDYPQGLQLNSSSSLIWTNSAGGINNAANVDIYLTRDAAGTLAQRNLGNAQTFRLYNTYTDATTFERLNLKWDTNVLKIGTEKGSVGGAARSMELQTDGATRMTVTSTGDVGIGTISPSTKLDIISPSLYTGAVQSWVASANSNYNLKLNMLNPGAVTYSFDLTNAGTLYSNNLVLDRGSVGIGTATPQNKLDVNGDTRVGGWLHVDRTGGSLSSYLAFKVRGAAEAGNFGNPAGNGQAEISFANVSGLVIGTNATSPIIFATQNLERLRILGNNGNVGIGITTPTNPLHVYGTTADQGIILDNVSNPRFSILRGGTERLRFNAVGNIGTISAPGGNGLALGGITDTSHLVINSSGNVGIGTIAPTEKLDVVGNAKVSGHFSAATKSFLIPHPTKPAKQLQYACLEGPENGVYIRGKTNESIILLPEYWRELVDEDSVTVTLTQIGKPQQLFVASQNSESVEVGNVDGFYNYVIFGERKDVDKLQTEI